jgi:hypothetical protein
MYYLSSKYQRLSNSNQNMCKIPLIEILNELRFNVSPDNFEELCVAVVILKIQALRKKRGINSVRLTEILGTNDLRANGTILCLDPGSPENLDYFVICKSMNKIETPEQWSTFLTDQKTQKKTLGWLNGSQASNFDSCVLTTPPLLLQSKQRLTARIRNHSGDQSGKIPFKEIDSEVKKCLMDGCTLIYITDNKDKYTAEEKEILFKNKPFYLVDDTNRKMFFGPYLSNLVEMALNATSTPAYPTLPEIK